jgi:flagellar protein FliO/FliZ
MITAGYILNLILMLALVAGMAVGALWLWRKAQPRLAFGQRSRLVQLVDAVPLGATARLAVVEFDERHLLIAVSRAGRPAARGRTRAAAGTPRLRSRLSRCGDGDPGERRAAAGSSCLAGRCWWRCCSLCC